MCGITALLLADQNQMASPELFEGLGMLQHRGQASSRILLLSSATFSGTKKKKAAIKTKPLHIKTGETKRGHQFYSFRNHQSNREAFFLFFFFFFFLRFNYSASLILNR
jgi:glutamine phosphoribosylpyrophosphate amidotransferase